ncbi:MAG: hypothetical protein Q4C49_04260 [Bacillota bacterium]|nr:hypothetical protein [Bacillota bacterium]
MNFTFKKLVFKSGKEQLLIEFSPKSDILSSFVEGEVLSFGKEILSLVEEAIQKESTTSFAGNSCIAKIDKEYVRIESQMNESFCILKTEEFTQIIHAYLKELGISNSFDNIVSLN